MRRHAVRRSRCPPLSCLSRSARGDVMTDIFFLIVTAAFFAVSVAYARGLDRI
jgi:hypothetical protein